MTYLSGDLDALVILDAMTSYYSFALFVLIASLPLPLSSTATEFSL